MKKAPPRIWINKDGASQGFRGLIYSWLIVDGAPPPELLKYYTEYIRADLVQPPEEVQRELESVIHGYGDYADASIIENWINSLKETK